MKRISRCFICVLCFALLMLSVAVPSASAQSIPNWAPNTAYSVGALVMYDGIEYKCIQAHTSEVGWEPPNVPALWQVVTQTATPTPTVTATATATPTPPLCPIIGVGGSLSATATTTSVMLLWPQLDPLPNCKPPTITFTIYENGVKIATQNTPDYTATGLTPSTTYTFGVATTDAGGTSSPATVTIKTLAAPTPTPSATPASTPSLFVTDITKASGFTTSQVFGVNNDFVVGIDACCAGSNQRGFIYNWMTGTVTLVQPLSPDYFTYAAAVNDVGEVVGFSASENETRPIEDVSGTVSLLTSSLHATPYAVNHSGVVVGEGVNEPILIQNGKLTQLPTAPGYPLGAALGINTAGEIVGYDSTVNNVQQPFLYANGKVTLLPGLSGATSGRADAINTQGDIVGTSGGHAFLLRAGGVPIDLGVLPGTTFSEAFAVDDSDTVVGSSQSNRQSRAFVWTASTGMVDLNTLIPSNSGVILTDARGIGGRGYIANGTVAGGAVHSFLLQHP